MLTRDDVIDIILERLSAPAAPLPARGRLAGDIRGRKFLSEYDIRKQLTVNSQELKIPRDSIISPLAEDWLTLRRIKITRE